MFHPIVFSIGFMGVNCTPQQLVFHGVADVLVGLLSTFRSESQHVHTWWCFNVWCHTTLAQAHCIGRVCPMQLSLPRIRMEQCIDCIATTSERAIINPKPHGQVVSMRKNNLGCTSWGGHHWMWVAMVWIATVNGERWTSHGPTCSHWEGQWTCDFKKTAVTFWCMTLISIAGFHHQDCNEHECVWINGKGQATYPSDVHAVSKLHWQVVSIGHTNLGWTSLGAHHCMWEAMGWVVKVGVMWFIEKTMNAPHGSMWKAGSQHAILHLCIILIWCTRTGDDQSFECAPGWCIHVWMWCIYKKTRPTILGFRVFDHMAMDRNAQVLNGKGQPNYSNKVHIRGIWFLNTLPCTGICRIEWERLAHLFKRDPSCPKTTCAEGFLIK